MEYQLPATTVETGAMPGAPYVVSQPMTMDGAYMTGSPYTTYGGYSMSPYMPAMPAVGGLDHSQGKWFAPGEALPPGYVITTHPEGHSAPQEGHAMSEMASASFVIPASSAAAAVKTGSAVKSKKSKKRANRSTSSWFARASFRYGVRTDQDNSFAVESMEQSNEDIFEKADQRIFASCDATADHDEARLASEVTSGDTGKLQPNAIIIGGSHVERLFAFKQIMFEMLWEEVRTMDKECLGADQWSNYLIKKLFVFDFFYQMLVVDETAMMTGDGKVMEKRRADEAFLMAVETVGQEVQIKFFLQYIGLQDEKLAVMEENVELTNQSTEDGTKEEGLPRYAPGSADEASWDMPKQQNPDHDDTKDGQEECEVVTTGCAVGNTAMSSYYDNSDWYINKRYKTNDGDWIEIDDEGLNPTQGELCLRGGMNLSCAFGNTALKTYYDKKTVLAKIADKSSDYETMDVRGGAGGATTTARKKQIRDVLKDMSNMLESLPDTQEEGEEQDQVVDKIVKDIQQLAENWKDRRPTKDQMKVRLDHLTERLDKTIKTSVSEKAGEGREQPKQSFYHSFQEKFDKRQSFDNTAKGKGKAAKGKGIGGDVFKSLPRFDLKRAYPSRSIVTWHAVQHSLENANTPQGEVALCDSVARISELQLLAAGHGITAKLLLIAKSEGADSMATIQIGQQVLLPYMGNIAMTKAIVASLDAKEIENDIGMKPLDSKEVEKKQERLVSLRITAVLDYIPQGLHEKLRTYPDYTLHLLGKLDLKESKTNGWTFDLEEKVLVGYCNVPQTAVEKVLKRSGEGGVFVAQLQKDIIRKPPATWYGQNKEETSIDFFNRVAEIAKAANVPMSWRRGSGLCLGVQVEDPAERNKSWICYGWPTTWGPLTGKEWLEKNQWQIAEGTRPTPPRGRNKGWFFQGYLPGAKQDSFSYVLFPEQDGKAAKHVTIRKWEKVRKVQKQHLQPITGPKWWSEDNLHNEMDEDPIETDATGKAGVSATIPFSAEIAKTVPDPDDADNMDESEGKRKNDESNSSSVKKFKPNKTKRKLAGGQPGPGSSTSLLDTGGQGDCGWRALAYSLAKVNTGKDDDKIMERLNLLATNLRIKVISHLIQTRKSWEEFWAVDGKWTHQTEAGPPATNISSFLQVLQRPLRWIDGLSFTAMSQLQAVNIIIFGYDHAAEDFKVLARFWGGADWKKMKLLPLVLDSGHYYALRKGPKGWPKEWMQDESEAPTSQEIGFEVPDAVVRGGGKFGTPQQRCLSEDDWLKTCSRKSSSRSSCKISSCSKAKKTVDKKQTSQSTKASIMLKVCSSMKDQKKGFASSSKPSTKASVMLRTCSPVDNKKNGLDWECPICGEVLWCESKSKAAAKIGGHMRRLHMTHWEEGLQSNKWFHKNRSGYSLGELLKPIKFVDMSQSPQLIEFPCPYCEKALPSIPLGFGGKKASALLRKSRRFHLEKDCKHPLANHTSLRRYWTDSLVKHPLFWKNKTNDRWSRYGMKFLVKEKEIAENHGHQPIIFEFPWKNTRLYGRHASVCKLCRLSFGRQHSRNKTRSCKEERKRRHYAPCKLFWRIVKEKQLQTFVKNKLGMKDFEIEKAIRSTEGWQPRAFKGTKANC